MRLSFLLVLASFTARADYSSSFLVSGGADGFQCLRAMSRTSTLFPTLISEDVLTRGEVVFTARGPHGVSAHSREGQHLSTIALDARGLSLDGERLWVRGDGIGIALIDVSNPSALRLVGTYAKHPLFEPLMRFGPRAVLGRGGLLWVAWSGGTVDVYAVSSFEEPSLLARHRLKQEVRALRLEGDVLLLEHADDFTVWNVKDPARPKTLGPSLRGRVMVDGAQWYLLEGRQLSELQLHDQLPPSTRPLATLGAHDEWVVAIADRRVLLWHDTHALVVLELPSLDFVGGISGNFETGMGPVSRAGEELFVSTRFGGLQRLDLASLARTEPQARFVGHPLDRNRYHGDILTVPLQQGESVARLLKRYQLDEPSIDWAHRMAPVVAANASMLPDLSRLAPGTNVRLPLPRTLLCRP